MPTPRLEGRVCDSVSTAIGAHLSSASHDDTSAVKSFHGGASVAESHRGTLECLWEMLKLSAASLDMASSAVADRKPMTEDGGLKKKAVRLGALDGLAAGAEEAAAA